MNSYKEYMYYLLHAPFKKVKREINNWKILMCVLGAYFDDLKEYLFLVREETSIVTATNPRALELIAIGMRTFRFPGETDEQLRKRLLSKRAIAEQAGTKEGILYALKSLGYDDAEILPVPLTHIEINKFNGVFKQNGEKKWHSSSKDIDHWAEFMIVLNAENPKAVQNLELLKAEIRKIKQGSSLPVFNFRTSEVAEFITETQMELKEVKLQIENEIVIETSFSSIAQKVELVSRTEISATATKDNRSNWNGERKWNRKRKWDSSIIMIDLEV